MQKLGNYLCRDNTPIDTNVDDIASRNKVRLHLCAEKDNVEVELALDGFTKPIGVAEYKLIVPQKELKQLISDEIKSFNNEIQQIID